MATEADSRNLWRLWTSNELGAYKEQWIAFRNDQVIAGGPSLSDLASLFEREIANGKGPLFAFITLEILQ
jgi:hypothetical protein